MNKIKPLPKIPTPIAKSPPSKSKVSGLKAMFGIEAKRRLLIKK